MVLYKKCQNKNNYPLLLSSTSYLKKKKEKKSINFNSIPNMAAVPTCCISGASYLKTDQNPKSIYRQPEYMNHKIIVI